jgi:hypothetical protein
MNCYGEGHWDCISNASFCSCLMEVPNKMVLHYTKLQRLARNKHTSLLGPIVSYKENELLWGGSLGLYCSYVMKVPKKIMLHYTKLESLARNKHTSLLGLFVSYRENEVLWVWLLTTAKFEKCLKNAGTATFLQIQTVLHYPVPSYKTFTALINAPEQYASAF